MPDDLQPGREPAPQTCETCKANQAAELRCAECKRRLVPVEASAEPKGKMIMDPYDLFYAIRHDIAGATKPVDTSEEIETAVPLRAEPQSAPTAREFLIDWPHDQTWPPSTDEICRFAEAYASHRVEQAERERDGLRTALEFVLQRVEQWAPDARRGPTDAWGGLAIWIKSALQSGGSTRP